ncbi:ABC transporter ATP-binding protein [Pelagibacterium sp.]|uniref:ABC transporter ATP-binding protein n=1 Tax=Pelagibacterium sp. TaxID=1967288 RepID=UPI003A955EDB
MESQTLLSVQNLSTTLNVGPIPLPAVSDVSFEVAAGQILGIVGESGSGKSVLLRSLHGLIRSKATVTGKVAWQGQDLIGLDEAKLRPIRGGEIGMIFQEPMTSLNPVLTVGRQIDESLRAHTSLDRDQRRARALEVMDQVGIPSPRDRINAYPHQFSGGMRQRVMIAIALAPRPRLLLADEPTTALDVTIQDQILHLLKQLAADMDMGVIVVTHDLGVVAQTCDTVAVMYAGRIVEKGSVRDVLRRPRHPYTKGLMQSVPTNEAPRTQLFSIQGTPPALTHLPAGCAYAQRCGRASDECRAVLPMLRSEDAREFACHHPVEEERA